MVLADDSKHLFVRVGERWFEVQPEQVRSVEAWQMLIEIPWTTRFLGLLVCRGEVVPVLKESLLGCRSEERKRIAVCSWADGVVGVPAAEVRLAGRVDGIELSPLAAALERAWDVQMASAI